MTTIADQLLMINQAKTDIAAAIQSKGVNPSGVPFTSYPFLINQIQTGGQSGLSASFYDGTWTTSDYMYILNYMTGYAFTGNEIDVSILNTVDDMLCVLMDNWTGASNFFGLSITTTDPEIPGTNTWRIDWGNETSTEHQNGETVRRFRDLSETWGPGTVIKVTPINGARFKVVDLGVAPPNNDASGIPFESTYLDIAFKGTVTESFTLSRPGFVDHPYLASAFIGQNMVTDFSGTFNGCKNLKRILSFETVTATSLTATFANCKSLVTIPPIDTSNCRVAIRMFEGTSSLMTVPQLNLQNLQDGTAMFSESGIIAFPSGIKFGGNSPGQTTLSAMFSGCRNLKSFPGCDFSNVGALDFFFSQCISLKRTESINSINCTRFQGMFSECKSIMYGPNIDTSQGNWLTEMFTYCDVLDSVYLNCSSVQNPQTIFKDCQCLKMAVLPGLTTSAEYSFSSTPVEVVAGSKNFVEITFDGQPVYLNMVKLSGRVPAWILNNIIATVPLYVEGPNSTIDFSSLRLDAGQISQINQSLILSKGYHYIPPTLV